MSTLNARRAAVMAARPSPSLDLRLTDGGGLDPRITFTRASVASYFDAAGTLQSAASGAPRFDFDPVTHLARGLLIEESRTNLGLRSAEFDNAAWTKARTSIGANAITSPDGTASADKLIEDTTATNSHLVEQAIAVTNTSAYTFSVFAKAGERTRIALQVGGALGGVAAYFDLSGGTIPSGVGTIAAIGNGWYRCAISSTATSTATGFFDTFLANPSGAINVTYTGDGTSGCHLWGAQVELGAFPTTYIATTAAAATRAADVATMPVGAWFKAAAGTFIMDFTIPVSGSVTDQVLVDVSGGATLRSRVSVAGFVVRTAIGAVGFNTANAVVGSTNRAAMAWDGVTGRADLNAGTVATAAIVTDGTGASLLTVGSQAAAQYLCGYARRVRYWPRAMGVAELQAVTR